MRKLGLDLHLLATACSFIKPTIVWTGVPQKNSCYIVSSAVSYNVSIVVRLFKFRLVVVVSPEIEILHCFCWLLVATF